MNKNKLIWFLQSAYLSDCAGDYILSDTIDNFIKKAALPYNPAAMDELPVDSRAIPYKSQEEDYDQQEQNRMDLFYKLRIPSYHGMPGGDSPTNHSIETKMHGPDPISGPAMIDQGNPQSSPSMKDDPDFEDFKYENVHEEDANSPEAWKNYTPRR